MKHCFEYNREKEMIKHNEQETRAIGKCSQTTCDTR